MTDHRALAIGYFNAVWELIELPERTAGQDRDMVGLALASRQHWIDAEGDAEKLAVSDWQVAHVASLAGLADVAMTFAAAAVNRGETDSLPIWLQASTREGLARAHAAAGDRLGYEREAQTARELIAQIDDEEDRELIAGQLASITPPV